MTDESPQLTYLLEISSYDPATPTKQLTATLYAIGATVRIVGAVAAYPAIIVEAPASARDRLVAIASPCVKIAELRRYFHASQLTPATLTELITQGAAAGHVAVGSAAVERAAQRRRLELLAVSANTTTKYQVLIEAFVKSTGYTGPRVLTQLSLAQLGKAAGVNRAGCVGLLRSGRK